jgi:O-antigen ligase
MGFLETLEGIGRISSVTAEPSVFAQTIVTLLPLTFPAWLKSGHVISRHFDRFCATIFVISLILCTSSTAYLGLLFFGLLAILFLQRTKTVSIGKSVVRALAIAGSLVCVAILTVSMVPTVRDFFNLSLLQKASSGSALERLMSVVLAFGYFQRFPVLGIGWGSATSHDLLVKLLSNVGLVGAFMFIGALWCIGRRGWRALRPFHMPIDLSRFAWILSFMVFILTATFTGFPLAFGNFWLILGMAMSVGWAPESSDTPLIFSHRIVNTA